VSSGSAIIVLVLVVALASKVCSDVESNMWISVRSAKFEGPFPSSFVP
jgi:hypothetical protein